METLPVQNSFLRSRTSGVGSSAFLPVSAVAGGLAGPCLRGVMRTGYVARPPLSSVKVARSPTIHTLGEFRYVDEGAGGDRPPVLRLHGMLGNIDNWLDATRALCEAGYRTLIPCLPFYDIPLMVTCL